MLAPGLRVVFCGTAAGEAAARVGAPYAGPGNRFYRVLHEVGLTPCELRPAQFRELRAYGIGLTDVAKYAVGRDSLLAPADFDAAAVVEKVQRHAPTVIAFVGKRAAQEVLGLRTAAYGEQDATIEATRVWIVPSTSGAARAFWDVSHWHDLASALPPPAHRR